MTDKPHTIIHIDNWSAVNQKVASRLASDLCLSINEHRSDSQLPVVMDSFIPGVSVTFEGFNDPSSNAPSDHESFQFEWQCLTLDRFEVSTVALMAFCLLMNHQFPASGFRFSSIEEARELLRTAYRSAQRIDPTLTWPRINGINTGEAEEGGVGSPEHLDFRR